MVPWVVATPLALVVVVACIYLGSARAAGDVAGIPAHVLAELGSRLLGQEVVALPVGAALLALARHIPLAPHLVLHELADGAHLIQIV